MKLFSDILADFTEEDWNDVKTEMKKFIVRQFEEMWEECYIWDADKVENMLADQMNNYIEEKVKDVLYQQDIEKMIMTKMLKQISGELEK